MTPGVHNFLSLDLMAMLAGTLAAVTCSLLGSFLVLRKQSLVGDAISHAVLPGLVIAFLVAGSRSSLPMFAGAAIAGVVAVALSEAVRRYGRVEAGAAMGVVFTSMFALGVLLIQRVAAGVDLDADCVLQGQLETINWSPPADWAAFLSLDALARTPRQVTTLLGMAAAAAIFVGVFYKELRLCAFDPGLAANVGVPPAVMNALLMLFVAAATVASFEAVGSILVVAMLICPAAAARLLTDRLLPQLVVSVGIAGVCGVGGYLLGAFAPDVLGTRSSLSASGMIAVCSGLALTLAATFGPRHGVLARRLRGLDLSITIALEDLLGSLYRAEVEGRPAAALPPPPTERGLAPALARRRARRRGFVAPGAAGPTLTVAGREQARSLIRTHRLWESWLVREAGLRPDHVHDTAMLLEHLRIGDDRHRLEPEAGNETTDPHHRPIPPP